MLLMEQCISGCENQRQRLTPEDSGCFSEQVVADEGHGVDRRVMRCNFCFIYFLFKCFIYLFIIVVLDTL
jgi:hypothetical protein